MRMVINMLDNYVLFEEGKIFALEIENREKFYNIVSYLNNISLGENIEQITFFDSDFKELNLNGKINVIIDYFNFDFNSNKVNQILTKVTEDNISDDGKDIILRSYKKIDLEIKKSLNKSDLPVETKQEFSLESIIKLLKPCIRKDNKILENILILFDIEKISNVNKLIVLINSKLYLSKEELLELYKYAIYNEIVLLLVDSVAYGICLNYEKKLIIDENLDEFMI